MHTKLLAGICVSLMVSYLTMESAGGTAPAKTTAFALPFMENQGQIEDTQVKFYARTFGGTVFVTPAGIVYALPHATGGWALHESFVGATPLTPAAGQRAAVTVSSFVGTSDRWRPDLPACDTITLGEVFNGITVMLKAYGNNVEKVFTVAPGADPAQIRVAIAGARHLSVNADGELVAATGLGDIRFSAPKAWQERAATQHDVAVAYRVDDGGYGFELGAYDPALPLYIDPLLASTLLGGNGTEAMRAVVMDNAQNIFVAGCTKWASFPATAGAFDTNHNGAYDVFVAKFDSNLTTLVAATFLGGSSNDGYYTDFDASVSLALDSQTNVFIAGPTISTDFPVTAGAWSTNFHDLPGDSAYADVFIAKLDANLTNLLAATFLGGTNVDCAYTLALDGNNDVFVAGFTTSANFPVTSGAFQEDYGAGTSANGFVAKLKSDLSDLLSATFLGGDGEDYVRDLLPATNGAVYLTGNTMSTNFPVSATGWCRDYQGNGFIMPDGDVFVTSLDSALTNLLASTYLGGINGERGMAVGMDGAGRVFVAGHTYSTNFPVSPGAYRTNYPSLPDFANCFVARLNASLTNLEASTFLGGTADDWMEDMAVNDDGAVFVAGRTTSADFPLSPNAYQTRNDNIVIARLNAALDTLTASTFLGSSDNDYAAGLTLDNAGNVLVVGQSMTDWWLAFQFPTTWDAYMRIYNNMSAMPCAFISKLDPMLCAFAAPTGFAASVGTYTDKVGLSWSNNAFAATYVLFRNASNHFWSATEIGATNTLAYDDTSAVPGSNYYYWVAGKFRGETGAPSDAAYGYRDVAGTPAAPVGVVAGQGTHAGMVYVTWQASGGATGYQVWRNTVDDFVTATNVAAPGVTSTNFPDTNALAGVLYYYWVKATNAAGASAFSSPTASGFRRAEDLLLALNLSLDTPLFLGGEALWFAQTAIRHDGVSAGQSGAITNDEWSWMNIPVTGPGNVSFWWRVSSEQDYDFLQFDMDGTNPATGDPGAYQISGEVDWTNETFAISAGNHTLTWAYVKDASDLGGDDAGWLDQVTFNLPPQTPPAGLAASDGAFTNKVAVAWQAVSLATGYTVWRSLTNDSAGAAQINTSTDTNFNDANAAAGLLYYYWVKATNALGMSAFSTADGGWRALTAPADVTASDGTFTDRVAVVWQAVVNASAYKIWRNPSNHFASAVCLGLTTGTAYDDTSVSAGVTNWYWVSATNAPGGSAPGGPDTGWRAAGGIQPPAAPTGMSASDGTYTDKVRVTWNTVTGANGYQVCRHVSDNSAGATLIGTTTSTTYDDTSTITGTVYYFWVKATNAAGASAFSASDTGWRAALPQPPVAPTGVSASDGTCVDQVRVTWNAVTNATTYQVWRNTMNNSAAALQVGGGSATAYDDTATPRGVTHYYWIKAVNAAGTSAFSAPDSGYAAVVGPLVSVNGMVGDNVVVAAGTPLTIAVTVMNLPAAYIGHDVDWWVAALAQGAGLWYYLDGALVWIPFDGNLENIRPAYQGPLDNLPQFTIIRDLILAPGTYNIWFAVDYPMDGILHLAGQILMSRVTVTVE